MIISGKFVKYFLWGALLIMLYHFGTIFNKYYNDIINSGAQTGLILKWGVYTFLTLIPIGVLFGLLLGALLVKSRNTLLSYKNRLKEYGSIAIIGIGMFLFTNFLLPNYNLEMSKLLWKIRSEMPMKELNSIPDSIFTSSGLPSLMNFSQINHSKDSLQKVKLHKLRKLKAQAEQIPDTLSINYYKNFQLNKVKVDGSKIKSTSDPRGYARILENEIRKIDRQLTEANLSLLKRFRHVMLVFILFLLGNAMGNGFKIRQRTLLVIIAIIFWIIVQVGINFFDSLIRMGKVSFVTGAIIPLLTLIVIIIGLEFYRVKNDN